MASLPAVWTGVDVHRLPRGVDQGGDLVDGLDRTGLVVGMHHRHQHSLRPQRIGDRLHVDVPGRQRRYHRHLDATPAQRGGTLEDGGVLDPAGNEMAAEPAEAERATQRQVDGLGAAAGEHHLPGRTAEQHGHLRAGMVEGVVGGLAEGVPAGRVAEQRQPAADCLLGVRVQRCGGRVVQVDDATAQVVWPLAGGREVSLRR